MLWLDWAATLAAQARSSRIAGSRIFALISISLSSVSGQLIEIALALAPRVVNIDDLQLRVEVQRRRSLLAVADAG